jgi:hypothetical protein
MVNRLNGTTIKSNFNLNGNLPYGINTIDRRRLLATRWLPNAEVHTKVDSFGVVTTMNDDFINHKNERDKLFDEIDRVNIGFEKLKLNSPPIFSDYLFVTDAKKRYICIAGKTAQKVVWETTPLGFWDDNLAYRLLHTHLVKGIPDIDNGIVYTGNYTIASFGKQTSYALVILYMLDRIYNSDIYKEIRNGDEVGGFTMSKSAFCFLYTMYNEYLNNPNIGRIAGVEYLYKKLLDNNSLPRFKTENTILNHTQLPRTDKLKSYLYTDLEKQTEDDEDIIIDVYDAYSIWAGECNEVYGDFIFEMLDLSSFLDILHGEDADIILTMQQSIDILLITPNCDMVLTDYNNVQFGVPQGDIAFMYLLSDSEFGVVLDDTSLQFKSDQEKELYVCDLERIMTLDNDFCTFNEIIVTTLGEVVGSRSENNAKA